MVKIEFIKKPLLYKRISKVQLKRAEECLLKIELEETMKKISLKQRSIEVNFSVYEEILDWKFVEQAAERYEKAAKRLREDAEYMKENNIIIGKL